MPTHSQLERMSTRELLGMRTALEDRLEHGEPTQEDIETEAAVRSILSNREEGPGAPPERSGGGASLDRDPSASEGSLETTAQEPGEGTEDRDESRSELPDCADHWWNLVCENGHVGAVPNTCKRRTCPTCAHRRYLRLMQEYDALNDHVSNGKLLTLTLKRGDNPRRLVGRIINGFKKLRRRGLFDAVRGGFYAIEVKPPDDSGGWYAHLHALIDAPYVPQEKISDEWADITGDSRVVDIRSLHDPSAGVRYVLGYTTKGDKIEQDWAGEDEETRQAFERAVAGRRLLQPFGHLFDVPRDKHDLVCEECQSTDWVIAEFDPVLRKQLGLAWGQHPDRPPPDPGGQQDLHGDPT
jgi:hypothetical protein